MTPWISVLGNSWALNNLANEIYYCRHLFMINYFSSIQIAAHLHRTLHTLSHYIYIYVNSCTCNKRSMNKRGSVTEFSVWVLFARWTKFLQHTHRNFVCRTKLTFFDSRYFGLDHQSHCDQKLKTKTLYINCHCYVSPLASSLVEAGKALQNVFGTVR